MSDEDIKKAADARKALMAEIGKLDVGDPLRKQLEQIQAIIDGVRSVVTTIRRENDALRDGLAEIEQRIEKIERNDKAPGVVPNRWKVTATHDAPQMQQ